MKILTTVYVIVITAINIGNNLIGPLNRFWNWYQTKIVHAIGFLFITHILQIPHFIWAGDAWLQSGYVAHLHPVLDFLLYGIDLIEIPALINVTLLFIAQLRKRNVKH